jgi:hypothetical protein
MIDMNVSDEVVETFASESTKVTVKKKKEYIPEQLPYVYDVVAGLECLRIDVSGRPLDGAKYTAKHSACGERDWDKYVPENKKINNVMGFTAEVGMCSVVQSPFEWRRLPGGDQYDLEYGGYRIDVKSTSIERAEPKYDSYVVAVNDVHKPSIDVFVLSWVSSETLSDTTESIRVRYIGWITGEEIRRKCKTRTIHSEVYVVPYTMLRPMRDLIEKKEVTV